MFVELNQYLFYRLLGSSVSVSQFRVDRHLHGFLGNHGLRLVKLMSKPLSCGGFQLFRCHSCMVFAVVCCDIYVHILKCVMMKVSDKYH